MRRIIRPAAYDGPWSRTSRPLTRLERLLDRTINRLSWWQDKLREHEWQKHEARVAGKQPESSRTPW